jgi:CheY-like chemotaxis protein
MATGSHPLFSTDKKNTVCTMPRAATSSRRSSCTPIPLACRAKALPENTRRSGYRNARPSVLWIDDYRLGLELYRAMFENLGYEVLTASSGEEGLRIAARNRVDVVVTDYEMPGMNGEAVASAIKSVKPELPVILFSGSTLVPIRTRRLVDAFCDKAAPRTHLLSTIERMLHKKASHFLQPPRAARASDVGHRTVA